MKSSGLTTDSPAKSERALTIPSSIPWRDIIVVVAVAWVARLAFMWLMPPGARSFDAYSWETQAWLLGKGLNPYQINNLFNWPPFWMQCVFIISKVAGFLHVPFFRVLQVVLILFETAVMVVTVRSIHVLAPTANARALVIIGMALNPVAILLVCQHCNFDVIMVLWVLLAVASLIRYNASNDPVDWLYACLFLGLGIFTKTVPLALVPLLAGGFRKATPTGKLLGAALVLGPVTVGMGVIFVLSPVQVAQNVLEYRSQVFSSGFVSALHLMSREAFSNCMHPAFYLLGIGVLVLTWRHLWAGNSPANRELVLYTALLLLAIAGEGSGFGNQYFYWFLPFLVISFATYPGAWRKLLVAFGIVSAITFIINYGLAPVYGRNFLFLLSHAREKEDLDNAILQSHDPLFLRVVDWSHQFEHPDVVTVVAGIPLFIAGLVVLVFGARILLSTIEGPPKKWFLRMVGFYVLYFLIICGVAIGVKAFNSPKPTSDNLISSETNQGQ